MVKDNHPNASNHSFPYFFDDTYGFTFGELEITYPKYNYDLAIYYNTLEGNDFIDCRCSRWDSSDFSTTIETWLKKSDINTLLTYIRPGAVGEFYKIIDRPIYYDKTWEGLNTIRLLPTPSSINMNESTLKNMREETIIYPKNITLHPIPGSNGWIEVKIEGYISGSNL